MDKQKVLDALVSRIGIPDKAAVIQDMLEDSIVELRNYLNYGDGEELPDGCVPALKQMVLIKYNQDGAEGISSEGNSGVSTTYLADLPKPIMRQVRKYRRLPR